MFCDQIFRYLENLGIQMGSDCCALICGML